MIDELKQLLKDSLEELKSSGSSEHFEKWRIRYLGSKGALKGAMARLKDVSKEDKPRIGQLLNEIKTTLEQEYETAKAAAQASRGVDRGPHVDVTEPGLPLGQGRRHVLSRTIDEITEVFARMGFSVAQGPEVEDEWHNFNALNIPAGHPAREPIDNFYLAKWRSGDVANDDFKSPNHQIATSPNPLLMLRSQTSTVQIRAMEKSKPPLKVIACGRVYRPDTHDATHYSMFHQVEGLYVDHNVTMVDLKTTLFQFAKAYFGEGADLRMNPSFFPFTEPSAEIAIKMKVAGQYKWVELGGCGMVDPNVFEAVGYDPEEWTGFAFGLGIERIAMRKYGISDIRWLFENDARFLRQF